jgi:hypothetical protein
LADRGRFEVLYWSLWKERWASTGPLGRTVLPSLTRYGSWIIEAKPARCKIQEFHSGSFCS